MTNQDAINSTFEVGKNMSKYIQEMYLKKHLKRTCHQKKPSSETIDGDQPLVSSSRSKILLAGTDIEMEVMVRNVQHHKESAKHDRTDSTQEVAGPEKKITEQVTEKICSLSGPKSIVDHARSLPGRSAPLASQRDQACFTSCRPALQITTDVASSTIIRPLRSF